MSRSLFLAIVCITFLLIPDIRIARGDNTAYVSDSFQITLRSGPGSTDKIIRMLHSDEPVQILNEEGNWLSVQLKDGTQGWVLKRFISQDIPKSIQLQKMKERYEQLASMSGGAAGKVEALGKENDSLKATFETNRSEYEQLQQKYTALKSDAANVLTLKKEYAATENKLKRTAEELKSLSIENEKLRMSSNLGWFLSGAGVVTISWLIGYMMGRSNRRKQGSRLY